MDKVWQPGVLLSILIFLISACAAPQTTLVTPLPAVTQEIAPALSSVLSHELTPVPTPEYIPAPTAIPIIYPKPDPAGCIRPKDDYHIVTVNGYYLNERTASMLRYAQQLYGDVIQLNGSAVTQGSFTDAVAESFGTHSGGGAVDLSVFYPGTYQPAYNDIGRILRALRTAGFAAWLRDLDELYPGSPIHIHAVAVGDQQLSPAALDQLIGETGYFKGNNGLPAKPAPDRFGGPILCSWMIEDGFVPSNNLSEGLMTGGRTFEEVIKSAANNLLTNSDMETTDLISTIRPVPVPGLVPENLDGPLAAAMLFQAGLVPPSMPLSFSYTDFWKVKTDKDQHFWTLLSDAGFQRFLVEMHLNDTLPEFLTGDILYLYGGTNSDDSIVIVNEVDKDGVVYIVYPVSDPKEGRLVQKQVLLDPVNPTESLLIRQWQDDLGSVRFELVRRPELALSAGTIIVHRVQPGETLTMIAAHYFTQPEAIARVNTFNPDLPLAVNQVVKVPVKVLTE